MTKLCLDCSEALCQSCSFARHSQPPLQEHKVIEIGLDRENIGEVSKLFQMLCELLFCDVHPSNPTIFYCNDREEYGREACLNNRHTRCVDVVTANAVELPEHILNDKRNLTLFVSL